ncbi:hypothetical protein OPS25_12615 [Alteromonas ponticola]|uniref:Uncharacterized protein n=1 Tax=Alteromonas aquimaris TaxID=2998417 RepID=A0ABT3P995_9ALTE|nr:hypothetical protein [Alteromonas aquimaris]MCW8109344.1 hypothetical protein [Alteromonas aquimaris]
MEEKIQLIQGKCVQLSKELEHYNIAKGNVSELKEKLAGFLELLEQFDNCSINDSL